MPRGAQRVKDLEAMISQPLTQLRRETTVALTDRPTRFGVDCRTKWRSGRDLIQEFWLTRLTSASILPVNIRRHIFQFVFFVCAPRRGFNIIAAFPRITPMKYRIVTGML